MRSRLLVTLSRTASVPCSEQKPDVIGVNMSLQITLTFELEGNKMFLRF